MKKGIRNLILINIALFSGISIGNLISYYLWNWSLERIVFQIIFVSAIVVSLYDICYFKEQWMFRNQKWFSSLLLFSISILLMCVSWYSLEIRFYWLDSSYSHWWFYLSVFVFGWIGVLIVFCRAFWFLINWVPKKFREYVLRIVNEDDKRRV